MWQNLTCALVLICSYGDEGEAVLVCLSNTFMSSSRFASALRGLSCSHNSEVHICQPQVLKKAGSLANRFGGGGDSKAGTRTFL